MLRNAITNENSAYALISMHRGKDRKGRDHFVWTYGAVGIHKDEKDQTIMNSDPTAVSVISSEDIETEGAYEVCVYLNEDEMRMVRRVINSAFRRARAAIQADSQG